MLQHYIKTAFRHLLKYKTQNLISILGLSVGILCFSICLYCSRFICSVTVSSSQSSSTAASRWFSPLRSAAFARISDNSVLSSLCALAYSNVSMISAWLMNSSARRECGLYNMIAVLCGFGREKLPDILLLYLLIL